MDAGFIFPKTKPHQKIKTKSQSYFQWMRVSYLFLLMVLKVLNGCRNPTFNGCGFHIKSSSSATTVENIVAILLSMDAGFIYVLSIVSITI